MSLHRGYFIQAGFTLGLLVSSGFFDSVCAQKLDTLPNEPKHYETKLAAFKKAKTTTGHILFLGNSITEGGDWKKLLKDSTVLNRGISGDNTFGVLRRLDEVARFKPSKLFLLIGVNDLSKDTPNARIIQNIFQIVQQLHSLSPGTQVFVQSLLPVNPSHKNFPSRFAKQSSIREINGQLMKYGDALKYTYVNLYDEFQDGPDLLNLKLTYDGLHLNAAGYSKWIEVLKKKKYL